MPGEDGDFSDEELGRARQPYYRISVALLLLPVAFWLLFFNRVFQMGRSEGYVLVGTMYVFSVALLINATVASALAAGSSQPPAFATILASACGLAAIASLLPLLALL